MVEPAAQQYTGKYESSGKIGNWLISRFFSAARSLLQPHLSGSSSVLEIGCGPGYSTARIRQWQGIDCLVAGEPEAPLLQIARSLNPDTPLTRQSVYSLAHPAQCFDAVIMLEVLEHLESPDRALQELHRVARNHVLLSTPREPIWRALNMARGKYLGALGNTPGHIQHWSTRGLKKQVRRWFEVEACATPLPWTILLLRPRR